MNTLPKGDISGAHFAPHKEHALTVLIAYEDFAAGKLAMETRNIFAGQFKGDCTFNDNMWKFDALQIPKLREIAAAEAAEADIIIIAAYEGDKLPSEVRSWIRLWLARRKEHGGAFVALLDRSANPDPENTPVLKYLEQTAAKAKMDFFTSHNRPFTTDSSPAGSADPEFVTTGSAA